MKKISFVMITAAFLVSTSTAFGQKKNQLEGVWKITEITVSIKDSTITNNKPQPSLIIFTKGYYSMLALRGQRPRPDLDAPKDPQNLTDAEKIARFESWRPFTANSGTYEIKGSTILRHPIVAKSVTVMTRETPTTAEFKLEGSNTLWLMGNEDSIKTRAKLIRVE